MNPLILFDYVFYRISCLYGDVFHYEASKELNGITILSLFQSLNLVTVLNLFELRIYRYKHSVIFFFLGLIVLFGLNYIRYVKKNRYDKLNDIWNAYNESKKNIRDILVILYFLASIVLIIII